MINRSVFILLVFFLVSCTSGIQNENQNQITNEQVVESKAPVSENKDYYTQIKVDTVARIPYPDFDTYESYQYKGYKLLTGMYKLQHGALSHYDTKNDYGVRLLALDKENKLVFQSDGQFDAYIYNLRFYEVDSQSPALLIAEIGNEGPWGSLVFTIDNNGVKEIGTIDLAGINTALNDYDDISKVTTIKKEGDNLIFRFTSDSIILDPWGQREQVIASKGFYYLYDGKELKAVKE